MSIELISSADLFKVPIPTPEERHQKRFKRNIQDINYELRKARKKGDTSIVWQLVCRCNGDDDSDGECECDYSYQPYIDLLQSKGYRVTQNRFLGIFRTVTSITIEWD
jgi:hypothetical protein